MNLQNAIPCQFVCLWLCFCNHTDNADHDHKKTKKAKKTDEERKKKKKDKKKRKEKDKEEKGMYGLHKISIFQDHSITLLLVNHLFDTTFTF